MPPYRLGVRGGVAACPCAGTQRAEREAWGPNVSKEQGMASKSLSSGTSQLGFWKVPLNPVGNLQFLFLLVFMVSVSC